MATTIADVMSALEQLLLEHFKSINSGTATQPFLAFELGTPIPDETFRNPVDPSQYSPALALEYLSHRSNAVPSIQNQRFIETGRTIDGLYQILLVGSTPVDAASMELLGAIKRTAETSFDQLVQAESGVSEQFRPTHSDPANWYDQSVASNWTPISINRSDQAPGSPPPPPVRFDPRLLRWNLAPVQVRPQLGITVSHASMSAIASAQLAPLPLDTPVTEVREAPSAMRAATMSRMTFRQVPAVATTIAPMNRSVVAANVPVARRSEFVFFNARDRFGLAGEGVPVPPPQPPVSSDSFSIAVEISIVKLRRSWLSDGLLNLNGWYVPSTAKGAFSGGTGASDSGSLPVLPVACVLIRNLAVHATWSDDDQKNLENSTHLGTFCLLGRQYDHNSATLTVSGMQSVAWICDPLPLLPPADPPAP